MIKFQSKKNKVDPNAAKNPRAKMSSKSSKVGISY